MIGASAAGIALYGAGPGSQAAAGNTGETEEERRRRILAQQQARLTQPGFSAAGSALIGTAGAGYGVALGS
jgi:hypothetical protein